MVTMAKACLLNEKANAWAMQLDFVHFLLAVNYMIHFKVSLHPFWSLGTNEPEVQSWRREMKKQCVWARDISVREGNTRNE